MGVSQCINIVTLTKLKKQKSKLSNIAYKFWALPDHPIHERHRAVKSEYSAAIIEAKREHLVMPEVRFRTLHRTTNSRTTPLRTELTGAVQAQANITCSQFGPQWFFVKVFELQCTGSEPIFP